MKNAEWCAANPQYAADEINRLETTLSKANENIIELSIINTKLQRLCQDSAEVAASIKVSLGVLAKMFNGKLL